MEILLPVLQYVMSLSPQQVAVAVIAVASFLSWLFQVVGWTKASKVVGTVSVDAGRVQRVLQRVWPIAVQALKAWVDRKKLTVLLYLASMGGR